MNTAPEWDMPGWRSRSPLVALFSAAALFELLRRRLGGLETPPDRVERLAGGARVGGDGRGMPGRARLRSACRDAANLALCIPLGLAVFYAAARMLRVPELEAVRTACYTFFSNAPRPEFGDPPARNR